jgi:hypothetical protein
MTTGAAQTLERAYCVAAGRRIVIAGNGPLNFQLAAALVAHGAKVVAVVEAAPRPSAGALKDIWRAWLAAPALMNQGVGYLIRLHRARVPVFWGHIATAAEGAQRVEHVQIAPLTADGDIAQPGRGFDADALCLGYGFVASTEIAQGLGCRVRLDPRHLGTPFVERSPTGETSVPGVFAVGDGAEVGGAAVAEASGELAGTAAATQLGYAPPAAGTLQAERRLAAARRFQDALWHLFKAPPVRVGKLADDVVLCRCEGVSFGEVRQQIAEGWQSLGTIKRRTRLGMGRCQGRYCTPVAVRLIAEVTGCRQVVADGFAPRLPAKPFPAAALAVEKPEWGGHGHRLQAPQRVSPRPSRY